MNEYDVRRIVREESAGDIAVALFVAAFALVALFGLMEAFASASPVERSDGSRNYLCWDTWPRSLDSAPFFGHLRQLHPQNCVEVHHFRRVQE